MSLGRLITANRLRLRPQRLGVDIDLFVKKQDFCTIEGLAVLKPNVLSPLNGCYQHLSVLVQVSHCCTTLEQDFCDSREAENRS